MRKLNDFIEKVMRLQLICMIIQMVVAGQILTMIVN
jgi:hypothetical protein